MVARRQKPIYAFIDSQNLNLGVRSQGWKLVKKFNYQDPPEHKRRAFARHEAFASPFMMITKI